MDREVELLALFKERDMYDKYRPIIKDYTITSLTNELIDQIGAWYEAHPTADSLDVSNLQSWGRVNLYPTVKREKVEMYWAVLDTIGRTDADPAIIGRFGELDFALRLKEHADGLIHGRKKGTISDLQSLIEDYQSLGGIEEEDYMVSDDIHDIIEVLSPSEGMEWRLKDLNKSVGVVHKSDLIGVAKRPEVGGTSFVVSEFVHMVHQLPEDKQAIIFHNEEEGRKIKGRLRQAALDIETKGILANPNLTHEKYEEFLGTKRIDVMHKDDMTIRDVENKLSGGEYGLIAINILEKVRGFNKFEEHERITRLTNWSRRLANKYGVVFVVLQSDPSTEGITSRLYQNQIYKSKTGVAQELDILLMIGASHEEPNRRYITIARNKKPVTGSMDKGRKHEHFFCNFDGETGIYTSARYS